MNNLLVEQGEKIISVESVLDILTGGPTDEVYYGNNILKIIFSDYSVLTSEQYKDLIYEYGTTLRQNDLLGRKLFVRMVSLLNFQRTM